MKAPFRDGSGLARPEIKPDGPAFWPKEPDRATILGKARTARVLKVQARKSPIFGTGENLRKNGLKLSKIPLKLSNIPKIQFLRGPIGIFSGPKRPDY